VLREFPPDVRANLGNDLHRLEDGLEPLDFGSMGAVLPHIYELRDQDAERWYRVLYIRLEGLINVLHCFTKTTNQTSQRDINTAKTRLTLVKQRIAEQRKKEKHEQRKR
jgi:phage-related protein